MKNGKQCIIIQRSFLLIVQKAYKYDAVGNVIKELDALGYESGSGTNADSKINNGYDTEYTYNLANKVIKVLDPVTKQKNLNFTKQYAYDALGRIVSEGNGCVKLFL